MISVVTPKFRSGTDRKNRSTARRQYSGKKRPAWYLGRRAQLRRMLLVGTKPRERRPQLDGEIGDEPVKTPDRKADRPLPRHHRRREPAPTTTKSRPHGIVSGPRRIFWRRRPAPAPPSIGVWPAGQ